MISQLGDIPFYFFYFDFAKDQTKTSFKLSEKPFYG
jgi:hypothetical protein